MKEESIVIIILKKPSRHILSPPDVYENLSFFNELNNNELNNFS